jgi:hypothetical protein
MSNFFAGIRTADGPPGSKNRGCFFGPDWQSTGSASGRSVAWLARLFRVQEVVSSNLTAPTIFPRQKASETRKHFYGTHPCIPPL